MDTERRSTPELHQRSKEIFHAVRHFPRDDWDDELARYEEDEPEAAREARELLAHLDSAPGFLARPLNPPDPSTAAAPNVRRIGGFRILASLGRGGMGIVYLAEQDAPQRRVALKLLRREIEDASATARFRREIEVLGRIEHPGIARIYKAGVAMIEGAELPWYAMEFVEGHGLVEHARRENLGAVERVRLLAEVCRAVHAAHVVGVVHRDLKPDNVLVDSSGRVRVLDFGVAAILDRSTDLNTLETATGELVGTVSYMSPEQASGGSEPVDARSDVYSLGVMLFELLSGDLPCLTRGQMLHEAVRAIREDEATSLARVRPELGREIAAVASKALEKAPDRRYASAEDFACDLERWLNDEPVGARPPHAGERLSKLVRRHRVLFGSIGFALLALSAGLIVALFALERTAKNLARADKARIQRWSDLRGIEVLETSSDQLWPAIPRMLPAIERWLAEAQRIADRQPLHEQTIASIARDPRIWPADDVEVAESLATRLREFADRPSGALPRMRSRAEFARHLAERTVDQFSAQWLAAAERVRSSPLYAKLELRPQIGLVPLGADAASGLEEFALFGESGAIPTRAEDGTLLFDEHSAIVLVLLPGGTYVQGGGPNDEAARPHEVKQREVTLDPFFISKYETTQAQWTRVKGSNPSYFASGESVRNLTITALHPVEFVSWPNVSEVFARLDLELPTEAQFEYAMRGGTRTIWSWGDDPDPRGAASLLGFDSVDHRDDEHPLADIWETHAPVGSFMPNGFGLYDISGNVYEWCRDPFKVAYLDLPLRAGDGLVLAESEGDKSLRGGSWAESAVQARPSHRTDGLPDWHNAAVGARAVRSLR